MVYVLIKYNHKHVKKLPAGVNASKLTSGDISDTFFDSVESSFVSVIFASVPYEHNRHVYFKI